MDRDMDTDAKILALRHVVEALWTNFIVSSGGDVVSTTKRVAEESLQSLEGIYARAEPGADLHPILQAILHHEESFWDSVLFQAEIRAGLRPPLETPGIP